MFKTNKFIYLLLALSFVNWFPALNMLIIHISLYKIGVVMLLAYFITPIASCLYIISSIFLMFKKRISLFLGSMVIATNVAYLIWGFKYLKSILYVT